MQRKRLFANLFESRKRSNSFISTSIELELYYAHTITDDDMPSRTTEDTFNINSKSALIAAINVIADMKHRDANMRDRAHTTDMTLSGMIDSKTVNFTTTSIAELRAHVETLEFRVGEYVNWALKLRKI